MATFTLISDPRIRAIPIRECGDPLVSIADWPALHLSRKRATANPCYGLVRSRVVGGLLAAQAALPAGVYLCLEEGFRSVALQRQMFQDYLARLRDTLGDISEGALMDEVSKYVAKPDGTPPHNTGGAVDVTLVSAAGVEYDLGSSSDDTPLENGRRNFTHAKGIGAVARSNRMLLLRAMEGAGFVNYPAEWWHWSLGDQYWAYRRGRRYAFYASAPFPEAARILPAT